MDRELFEIEAEIAYLKAVEDNDRILDTVARLNWAMFNAANAMFGVMVGAAVGLVVALVCL